MYKNLLKRFLPIMLMLALSATAFGQTTISGKITDSSNGEVLIGVNILIKGTVNGTTSDVEGNFNLTTKHTPPLTLQISVVGYAAQEIAVEGSVSDLDVKMTPKAIIGQEIVISASRVEESMLESPVSIEKMDLLALRNTASASFYDALINLKGVDMSTQSLTFKSPNTRGFGANGNTRFTQLIDGMDNQAPGLNFAVGNMVGISELDVESMELLPGASSALYGPGAINGTLLVNSKSPFNYQGLSAYVKTGMMDIGGDVGQKNFNDVGFRYAKVINDKFAFKVNVNYLQATDWHATNFEDKNGGGADFTSNRGYNGVNTYGDEASANMQAVGAGMAQAGLLPTAALAFLPNEVVSRTGYQEKDLVDYGVTNLKINGALHYRINEDVEAFVQASYGKGTTVYTGLNRYSLKALNMTQIKAEIRGSNFFLRGYTTLEDSGDSYDASFTALAINGAWKDNTTWFGQYTGAYVQALQLGNESGAAHNFARQFADQGRFLPGTAEFENAKKTVTNKTINAAFDGSKFQDATKLYHAEGMYNFSKIIDPSSFEAIVGASYRYYDLNSNGTIFWDTEGQKLGYGEIGAYAQVSKRFMDERLKLSASARYDKNENFDGRLTPRLSAVATLGAEREHNIRLTYQTGFRNPTAQGQFIDLNLGAAGHILGGLPQTYNRYINDANPVYSLSNVGAYGAAVQAAAADPALQQAAAGQLIAGGANPADPNFTALVTGLVTQLAGEQAKGSLQAYTPGKFKPERVSSYEVGYKGLLGKKVFIDGYYYHNTYNDFIVQDIVLQSTIGHPLGLLSGNTRQPYSIYNNATDETVTWGWALGLDFSLPKGFNLGANVAYNTIDKDTGPNADRQYQFNTAPYRYVVKFGNREVIDNLGFQLTYRWQDTFYWESSFGNGDVPSYGTLDAQLSYKVDKMKTIVKLGGSNILNERYFQAYGNPTVGSMFYLSLTFDQFMN